MQLFNLLRGSPGTVMLKNSSMDDAKVFGQPADCSRIGEVLFDRPGMQNQFFVKSSQFFND